MSNNEYTNSSGIQADLEASDFSASDKYKHILALVPAYREEKNVASVVAGIRAHGLYDILVINDCSPDNTVSEALKAGAKVVSHPINLGAAITLQTGYKYALSHGYKYIIQLDGDGQHDPIDVPTMLEPLLAGEADFIIGSRFVGVGNYQMPFARKMGKKLFAFLTKTLVGITISDPTSGYKAMTRDVFKLYTSDLYPDEYPDADIIILAVRAGFKVKEVGVHMHPSNTGQTIHSGVLRPLYYGVRMLLGIFVACLFKVEGKKS